ncbi:MAG: hypothetical protein R3D00_21000 [Bacteroidia bacterium]
MKTPLLIVTFLCLHLAVAAQIPPPQFKWAWSMGGWQDDLDRQELDSGFLVIFEGQKEKSGRQEEILHRGKTIFAVWV